MSPGGLPPEAALSLSKGVLGRDSPGRGLCQGEKWEQSQARVHVGPQCRGVRSLGCLGAEGLGDGLPRSCQLPGPSVAAAAEDPGVAARALACVADVLGCMAEGRGGLRSGPAANPEWVRPFSFLERGDLARGVEALTQERARWLSR